MIKDCHVGIKGIICTNGQCLVLQKDTDGDPYWDVPGGRIDNNETIAEALSRELREELPSIKNFSIGEVVGAYRLNTDLPEGRGLVLIFYKVDTEEFDVALSDEHCAYRWVSKETLPELRNSDISIKPELYDFIEKVLG